MGPSRRDNVTSDQDVRSPLLAIDGMSLAFRAYFALPTTLTTSDGTATNAVHGFVSMLVNLIKTQTPSGLVVAFDLPEATFRDEIIEDYKGGRAETPEDLLPQFDMIRTLLEVLSVPVLEVHTFEADDILATLADRCFVNMNDIVVVSGDRDLFQVVHDPYVKMLYNRKGVSEYDLYDEEGILARTGVRPDLYPSLAALRGDPSDNLPGIPGIGEKTAAKLLGAYGTLDEIFSHVEELTPKLRQNLVEHESLARRNAKVIPLRTDVEIGVDTARFELGSWDYNEVKECFARFELRTLWSRVEELLLGGKFGSPKAGSSTPAAEQSSKNKRANNTYKVPESTGGDNGEDERSHLASKVGVYFPVNEVEALELLDSLQGEVSDGHIGLSGVWEGERGRTFLLGVVLCDRSCKRFVWLEHKVLVRARVAGKVSSMFCARGMVGDGMKELFRSLIPLGLECRGLAMDVGVAEFLLGELNSESTNGSTRPTVKLVSEGDDRVVESDLDEEKLSDIVRQTASVVSGRVKSVQRIKSLLDQQGMRILHDEVETPLVRVLAKMEVTGVRVDVEELRRITDSLVAESAQLKNQIYELAGHEFNVNSTPQLRTVLFEEIGLTPSRKTKTGYSTDVSTLEMLRGEHPIIEALLRYREIEKLRSTYGDNLLKEVAEDGRIHASFRQTVARTGRLSSDRPNLHNIPTRSEVGSQFRKVFIPADGWSFLAADYDQIELRVLAHLSKDGGLLDAFRTNIDVHRAVASGVYGLPPEEVTHAQRERAKMISYGLIYGMESYGLARRLATSVDEAREIMDRYFEAFPNVQSYMKQVVTEAREKGYTTTPMGRRRYLPDLKNRNTHLRQSAERQAMNAGIQGFAADIFKVALVRLDGILEAKGVESKVVLQVHDEVLLEVARGEENVIEQLTLESMRGAADLLVDLEVSMGWGKTWSCAKAST